METLQIGMHFDESGGGADRYFAGLLRGMKEPFTAGAFGVAPPSTPGRNFVSLGSRDAPLLQRLKAIRRIGARSTAEVVATHFALYGLPLGLGRKKHVVHFHGPWALESAKEGQRALVVTVKKMVEQRVYSSAHRLITLSQAFKKILIENYRIPSERVAVVPGGVDLDHFRPAETREAARQWLGWPANGKIILCVRRLVPRMGLEMLVEAFAALAPDQPNATLVIAGRGPLEKTLRQQVQALGLGSRVLLTGFLPEADLPIAYTAADFSIVPSQAWEGFGLVTLESLACGTPVFVTPVGGLPETIAAFAPELILPDIDRAALGEAIGRGLRGDLPNAEACRRYVAENFSWSSIAQRVEEVYRS